jgi:hypothetical protein
MGMSRALATPDELTAQPGVVFVGARPGAAVPQGNPVAVTVRRAWVPLALGVVGIAVGAVAWRAARNIHEEARLQCHLDEVGVPNDYHGNWWVDRGNALAKRAVRMGATTAEEAAGAVLVMELGEGPEAQRCLEQFPPGPHTLEQNVRTWETLVTLIAAEYKLPRAA